MRADKIYGNDIFLQRFVLSRKSEGLLKDFSCGNDTIDQFYQEEASTDENSVTYVYINEGNGDIVACVTIECSAVYFNNPSRGINSDFLSAIEIDYFAINEKYQHMRIKQGSRYTLGDYILRNVLKMLKSISQNTIGAAKVVLYSVPSAMSFYLRNDFFFFEENMAADSWNFLEGCIPMHFDLNKIVAE